MLSNKMLPADAEPQRARRLSAAGSRRSRGHVAAGRGCYAMTLASVVRIRPWLTPVLPALQCSLPLARDGAAPRHRISFVRGIAGAGIPVGSARCSQAACRAAASSRTPASSTST